ncbi:Y-family DNA polymerase [Oharaeibacter diazotrophicus]|uniref:DNA-directed DNA polymerase n=2 Tax=Oharaeibacter diazotrophicus TaxID=1920512 RepID=A0A4R6RL85_9HYPH|nr:protein ImuB [Oharaeibacter diazotrophicus]BBE70782.1 DNA polymerase IV [Pleomorphomonas sp. SM30]GLS77531.1 DNA-directed DNA polymerase [Oharaeibacter diazotrophicus]
MLVAKERGALRLVAVDGAAAALGLAPGMALAEARALVPDVATADAAPEADAALLRGSAEAMEIFTPLVALRGHDGLVLDVTGCAHLFGGERGLGAAARRRLARAGLQTQGAIAGTPEAAWAFARHRPGSVTPPGGEAAAARGLPVAALEQDEAVTLALVRAGLRSLGDLADRPSPVLAARFGEGVTTALRRITGREDIRVTPLRPPPVIMAERHFQEPFAELDGLLAVLERLAGDVTAALEARGAGGRAFEAAFFRADGAVRHLVVETAGPTRDAAALMRLIRLRIEALADPLDPGFGFDALRLVVLRGEALEVAQPDLAGGRDAREEARALAGLVDRLVARFGRETVRRFVARDSHDPVRAGGTVPWLEETDDAPWPEPEPGQPPARPLTLFGRPQPIDVLAEVPDSPPLRFRWRRVLHEVARAEGPERIAPEWWRAQDGTPPPTRDYYRVEDAAGHRFWIFREGLYEEEGTPPRWFVHGLFA